MFQIKRSALSSEMPENQRSNIQEVYQVPLKCASPDVLYAFDKYITNKSFAIYK